MPNNLEGKKVTTKESEQEHKSASAGSKIDHKKQTDELSDEELEGVAGGYISHPTKA